MVRIPSYLRARLADLCYGRQIFDLGMFHPGFIAFFLVLNAATIGVESWRYYYIWPVHVAIYFAIWVAILVAIARHRKLKGEFKYGTVATDLLEGQFVQERVIVTHPQLDIVRRFSHTDVDDPRGARVAHAPQGRVPDGDWVLVGLHQCLFPGVLRAPRPRHVCHSRYIWVDRPV